jgi:hypothetical protein
VCPDICGQLPEKQRQAAGLAVSMVALTSCEGDVEGAARAVATAAADGDLSAFGAGLSVGAAVLAGRCMMGAWCCLPNGDGRVIAKHNPPTAPTYCVQYASPNINPRMTSSSSTRAGDHCWRQQVWKVLSAIHCLCSSGHSNTCCF